MIPKYVSNHILKLTDINSNHISSKKLLFILNEYHHRKCDGETNGLWKAQPQWIDLHYIPCNYSSGDMVEETEIF